MHVHVYDDDRLPLLAVACRDANGVTVIVKGPMPPSLRAQLLREVLTARELDDHGRACE